MKTKTTIKLICSALFLSSALFLYQCKQKLKDDGINGFLNLISLQAKGGQKDALLANFDMPQKQTAIKHLANLLCNISGVEKGSKPIFKTEINPTDNDLKSLGEGLTQATFSVVLTRDSIETKTTKLSFKIKTIANNKFKIVGVDATQFSKDYVEYQNIVRLKTLTDKDIFDPLTLAAFKTAAGLKGKYDSIPWFQHMGDKTYYFVAKGDLKEMYRAFEDKDTVATYKLGLVGPDGNEIITPGYDLIHNIGATFPDWIEVEKDKKRGFFDLKGKALLPVEYNEILPVNDADNLALLRKGDDYYWWKKDQTVSEKDPSVKIGEVLPKIQAYGKTIKLTETVLKNITEYNSRERNASIYIPPSYLADWGLLTYSEDFKNPMRKFVEYEDANVDYALTFEGKTDNESWLSSVFYSISNHYLGGRGDFYTRKNVLLINKNKNRIYSAGINTDLTEEEGGSIEIAGKCNINALKTINDTLYEIQAASNFFNPLHDRSIVSTAPGYHYLALKHDKLVELPNNRMFGFTKYVKMDDSYLRGCYEIQDVPGTTGISTEMLRYMKNEIYADYHYKFKDSLWTQAFQYRFGYDPEKLNANVDDSLTAIDKYNIAFINKKLTQTGNKNKVLAAK